MTTEPGPPAGSHAVLIGVSAYEHAEFPPIRAARNSLQAMRELLSDPALCGWPPERVTVIANPLSAVDLLGQVTDLAETTTGVLLLYYAGHGALTARGELCLTVTATRPDRPKITGLHWIALAEVLRASPARTRIAILDCCFAGQAIEALAGDDGPGLADITYAQGVYTLTATTRNHTAHVPPPDRQDIACTSFTGELRDLIHAGVPGKPSPLTLGDIYPVLRARLQAKGLPTPNQRGTDTAGQFPFAINRAVQGASAVHTRPRQDPGGPAVQTDPAPTSPVRAARLLDDAIRAVRSISGERPREEALADVAKGMVALDPDRAERLAQSITNWEYKASVAKAMVAVDPDRAERLAQSLGSAEALAAVAGTVAAADPDRAKRLAAAAKRLVVDGERRSPSLGRTVTEYHWALVRAGIAKVVVVADPGPINRLRAKYLASNAETLAKLIFHESHTGAPLADMAKGMVALDLDRAERLAQLATNGSDKASTLAVVAMAVAAVDPDRAERLAQSITDERLRAAALVDVAKAVAVVDPDRAERLAQSITDVHDKASILADVAKAVAAVDPDRTRRLIAEAERVVELITDGSRYLSVLAYVGKAVAVVDPDRAERLAQSMPDKSHKALILADVAKAVVTVDPDRAERLVQSITDERLRAAALVDVAMAVAVVDPDRAERLAQSITDGYYKALALAAVAKSLFDRHRAGDVQV